jgi:FkbM family methyltransferase
MHDHFNCICYAIEASPALFIQLPSRENIHPFNYAIGKENGFAELYLWEEPEANSLQPVIAANWDVAGTVTVPAITLEKFLEEEQIPLPVDLPKIDIEGAEVDVINTLSPSLLGQIRQIPVEFHDFLNFSDEYREGMRDALKKLKENNFLVIRFSAYDNREVLCINKSLITLNFNQKFRLNVIHSLITNLKSFHTRVSRVFNGNK